MNEATNVQAEPGVKMSVQTGEMVVSINKEQTNNTMFSRLPQTDPVDIKFENVRYTATVGGLLGYKSGV